MQQDKMQQTEQAHELVSALADGELQGTEFIQALAVLESSAEARACWHGYHLVGDVLRSGAGTPVGSCDEAFMTRLRQRLQGEGDRPFTAVPSRRLAARDSANDVVWRWKLVAGLSSLAVAGVLGWQLLVPSPQAVQMAASNPAPVASPALATAEAPVMIRDPRLDQLIAAHQQQGGTSALQMPAGFLRNATFERPAR